MTGILYFTQMVENFFIYREHFLGTFEGISAVGEWVGGGGLQDFSVSPSPLWVNLGFKLGWTGLGLGLEGLGTQGFGVGDQGLTIAISSRQSLILMI